MSRALSLGALLLAVGALPACTIEDANGGATPAAGRDGTAQEGLDACFVGDVPEGLGLVQRRAESGEPDALTARALCRWMAFAADSSEADARAALADYDEAIRRADDAPSATPVDHLYAQRGLARLMLNADDWDAVIEDLDTAARLQPASARHVLDRAFVHLAAADTAAAIADLERVLLVDAADTVRMDLAKQVLYALTDVSAETFFRPQETVVF